jgi:ABC-2 type transport system permease protein
MPKKYRPLIVKDVRIFQRDPMQWGQFLIFFCLLALYFVNIRRVTSPTEEIVFLNLISFLNVTVVGLILSTFTTRFIFPMISLEGSRFWILGLLPIHRDTILWGKFLLAAIGSAIPSTVLILVSDVALQTSPSVILLHQLTCLLLCSGLSGLAVGLGAMMPNLTEQSPSKIAAGAGGTLNLVLSAAYIIAIVALTGVPYHFFLMVQPVRDGLPVGVQENFSRIAWTIWTGIGLAIVLGVVTTVVPLRRGLRAFRRMEFL